MTLDTQSGRHYATTMLIRFTIDSVDDMTYVGGEYIDEGTEVEVSCVVDCDGDVDEVTAVADGREVALSDELIDAVKAYLGRVPDAAEVYSNEVMFGR